MVIKFITLGYVGFFVVAGINHFINPIFYDKIVPDFIPFPRFVHLATGVIEIILPLFFFTRFRKEAAILMIVFLVVIYIGNVVGHRVVRGRNLIFTFAVCVIRI